ncbi:3-methyl-2-oxobutanoate dehydrogenase subunit VorB [Haloplasma contractile]|uniref:2-oxoglutarate ferredoxin oxidoreductase subunit alpha protein n=1 Tax=Haloplasma contractile SSD-17B TaxID=1033810 RepID=U2E9R8_9MOLU|nr:3-methyl-2-oxobutanoate dehydrogenase subunit VorB [Haloplasma contractile]ERJ11581.1 2-oxoglutarate ferredoxin oxidoreductase subunit alpha protein [Haloplasma contractile SSD-17B]
MAKVMMKGNEAMALAAIKGGCKAFFGYPITPQNELPEYLSKVMHEYNGVFVQAESEVAAINMVYGAAGAGARVLTSSSSPGIALKQEGISYIAGAELPAVIINVMRGGPGLGGIQPSQADYKQVTRGGGNGDYYVIAYAPENLQETVEIIKESFDVADQYRNPVMIAVDGLIGQMMEPVDVEVDIPKRDLDEKTWATTGTNGERKPNDINSLFLDPQDLENHSLKLQQKYNEIKKNEQRYEFVNMQDADLAIVAYGTMSRVCRSAIETLKEEGINVGLLRPISIWPFPEKAFDELPESVKGILTCEMSTGQMLDDVKIVNNGKLPVDFFGRTGGMVPEPEEIINAVKKMLGGLN